MLVVSFTHAMVHLIEQSFGSVEQVVAAEYSLSTQQSGALGSALRIPFGFGAVVTGILADRLGATRILSLYLAGIAAVCSSFLVTTSSNILWWQMLMLGVFASMYHPAGLSLMASVTTPKDRARSLGIHGVFGSLGLASAPFLALAVLSIPGTSWTTFFVVLSAISGTLFFVFRAGVTKYGIHRPVQRTNETQQNENQTSTVPTPLTNNTRSEETTPNRLLVRPFCILMISSAFSGIVYGGFLHFLTRYLSEIDAFDSQFSNRDSIARFQSSVVLFCGVGGQWLSGYLATPKRLPMMLSLIYLTNVPLLCWMSFSSGLMSLLPCCLLAFVHFMNQPVYNSLLPDYVPLRTRSTWFGFSQMMTFGIGAAGPYIVGSFGNYRDGYLLLAGLSFLAGLLPIAIWAERRRQYS